MKKEYDYEVAITYDNNVLTWATGDTQEELEKNINQTIEFCNWDRSKVSIKDIRWAGRKIA